MVCLAYALKAELELHGYLQKKQHPGNTKKQLFFIIMYVSKMNLPVKNKLKEDLFRIKPMKPVIYSSSASR